MTGCVTSALWESERYSRIHEPALPLNLHLYQSETKRDVLVQYDEWIDVNEKVCVRTYWLGQDGEPGRNPHKPNFVSSHMAEGLSPIPLIVSELHENVPYVTR